jgi:hypothetical protein
VWGQPAPTREVDKGGGQGRWTREAWSGRGAGGGGGSAGPVSHLMGTSFTPAACLAGAHQLPQGPSTRQHAWQVHASFPGAPARGSMPEDTGKQGAKCWPRATPTFLPHPAAKDATLLR